MSMTAGQQLRVDFRPVAKGEVDAVVESRFNFPGPDFTHENEKNVGIVVDLLTRLCAAPEGEVKVSTA